MKNRTSRFLSLLTSVVLAATLGLVWWCAYTYRPVEPERLARVEHRVPTEITVASIRFREPRTMQVTGSLKLRYDSALRWMIERDRRGVVFPGAEEGSVGVRLVDESWLDATGAATPAGEVTRETQVLTFSFDIELDRPPDPGVYPFDRIETLRLRPKDSGRVVRLDPLVSVTDTVLLPPGWSLAEGAFVEVPAEPPADFDYVLAVRREPAGILLRELAPILAALAFLFVVALGAGGGRSRRRAQAEQDARAGSFGVATVSGAALLLVVGFAHSGLRGNTGESWIAYLETFHGIAYVTIVVTALAAGTEGRSLDRLRLLYWPLVMGLALLAGLTFLPGWVVPQGFLLLGLLLAGVFLLVVLLLTGRRGHPGEPIRPTVPGPVHFLSDRSRPLCGAAADFVSADREQVTCRACHERLYRDSQEPAPLDTWIE